MFKAIFFDRDGTLTYNNELAIKFRDKKIAEWSGHIFELPYEKFINIFMRTKNSNELFRVIRTLDEEKDFFAEFYRILLKEEGITVGINEKIDILTRKLWVHERKLYPETIEVLKYFKQNGYEMGVISDTSLTLEETLRRLNIAKYFKSFTSSAEVGVGKPDPKIYNTALKKHNVKAEESIYVDDYEIEAIGARDLGFTSFFIDRNGKEKTKWTINNLKDIKKYIEKK
jgi:HAD superfamily hydrolase (TIGR01509 family)